MSGILPRRVALAVFLPFAAAYALSYVFRSVNAVIAPDLVAQFGLGPSALGLLTSAYFLAFASFQLPLGVLLDRFGPRRTDAALLLFAVAGAVVFATARNEGALVAGRALIGLGVCGCLMSGIKAHVLWFPLPRLPALNGWLFFCGGLGMIAATVPVERALEVTDWRGLFLGLAAATLVVAAAIYRVVPERPPKGHTESLGAQLRSLVAIFAARRFWAIALAAMLTQSTNMAVQGLWAGPWLRDVAGLDRPAVASHLFSMALATTAGFLFWGNFTAWIARRGVPGTRVLAAGMGAYLVVMSCLVAGVAQAPAALWIAFGLFGTCGSLSFALLSARFPPHLAGRVTTALNSLVFTWAFLVQWGIGAIIGRWPIVDGHYHPSGYRAAFAVFLGLQLVAWGWMLLETRRLRQVARG